MKIALMESYGKFKSGAVIDLPDDEALRLINTGNAVPVECEKQEPKPAEKPAGKRSK